MLDAEAAFNIKIKSTPDYCFFDNSANLTETSWFQKLPPIKDPERNYPLRRLSVDVISPEDSNISFSIF